MIVTSKFQLQVPEGSTEEAAALERDDESPTPLVGDVDIVIVPERGVLYGQDLKAKLVFTSKAASAHTVNYVTAIPKTPLMWVYWEE